MSSTTKKTEKRNKKNLINEKANKEHEETYYDVETEMPQQNMESVNKITDFSCQVRNLQINIFMMSYLTRFLFLFFPGVYI